MITPNQQTPAPRRPRRTAVVCVAVAVLVASVVGAVVMWPEAEAPVVADDGPEYRTSSLSDMPPTVILNALDVRSLYPPGYIDYDSSEAVRDPLPIDVDADYQVTSDPAGCDLDPLTASRFTRGTDDPDRYRRYPITLLMFPVSDPGGNQEDSRAFGVSIFPSPLAQNNLDEVREWYGRCEDAVVTTTVVKNGQILRQTSRTNQSVVVDAPKYDADDSLSVALKDRDICDFVGLVRGIIIDMHCPSDQKDAGAELFRTLTTRIRQA